LGSETVPRQKKAAPQAAPLWRHTAPRGKRPRLWWAAPDQHWRGLTGSAARV